MIFMRRPWKRREPKTRCPGSASALLRSCLPSRCDVLLRVRLLPLVLKSPSVHTRRRAPAHPALAVCAGQLGALGQCPESAGRIVSGDAEICGLPAASLEGGDGMTLLAENRKLEPLTPEII